MALSKQGKIDEAMAHWREHVRLRPSDPRGLSQLAWAMATRPEPSVRTPRRRSSWPAGRSSFPAAANRSRLTTLAAAYARAGRFDDAARTAAKALVLAQRQQNQSLAQSIKAQTGPLPSHNPIWKPQSPPSTAASSDGEKGR